MKQTTIGVDPGENNGVALYATGIQVQLFTMTFWELILFIQKIKKMVTDGEKVLWVVENPMLNNFMYDARTRGQSQQAALKIARNVGMNHGDTKRILERIRMLGMEVQEVRPNNRDPKWSGDYFNRIIRTPMRCNQHERDAAKLISRYWIDDVQKMAS
jgi:hypothetical protein